MEQPVGQQKHLTMSSTAKWGEIIFWVLVSYAVLIETLSFLSSSSTSMGRELSVVQICRVAFTLLLLLGIHTGKELPVKLMTFFFLLTGAISVITGLGFYGSTPKISPLLLVKGAINIAMGLLLATPAFTAFVKYRALRTEGSIRDPAAGGQGSASEKSVDQTGG